MNRLGVIFAVIVLLGGRTRLGLSQDNKPFDHWQHRNLFPSCVSCHAGVQESDRPLWPAPSSCADCHDGTIEERVEWQPPSGPPRTNLRFTHRSHAESVSKATAKAIVAMITTFLNFGVTRMLKNLYAAKVTPAAAKVPITA